MSFIANLLELRATKYSGGDPRQPQYWVQKMFGLGGTETDSGIQVDEDSALTFSAVWAAVNIISGAVGFLPWHVYQHKSGGGRDKAKTHSVYNLLHNRANPYMSAQTFRETLEAHALTWGNGYAEIERDNALRPKALWPILPNSITPKVENNILFYEYTPPDKPLRRIPASDIFHVKGLGFDGISGYSVVRYAAQSLGVGLAAEKFGAKFFGNGTQLGGVLKHPMRLDDQARENLKKTWKQRHTGTDNAHSIAILEEGMEWQQIGIPPEDAQFLETRKFSITDVSRWFQIAPHMLGDLERATFSNIEHQGIEFVTWTLARWLKRWEHEANAKLFADNAPYYTEFDTAALLRGDTKSRYESHRIALLDGWKNRDEIRELENLNPLPNGEGKEYYKPANMDNPGGDADSTEEPKGEDNKDKAGEDDKKERFRSLFDDTFRRLAVKESKALSKVKGVWPEAVDEFYTRHLDHVRSVLEPVVMAWCGDGDMASAWALRYVDGQREAVKGASHDDAGGVIDGLAAVWPAKIIGENSNE